MLTDAQIEAAISYNRTYWREKNVDTRRIQWAVGSYPDGLWGPNTVNAIALWQNNNALAVDGKWGPATNGTYWHGVYPVFGVWSSREGDEWDDHFELYLDTIFACGFSEIVLELNDDSDDEWTLSQWQGGLAQLVRTVRRLESAGLRVVLWAWPQPEKSFVDDMVAELTTLREILPTVGIEYDMEGHNWPGSTPLAQTQYLFQQSVLFRPTVTTHGGRLGVDKDTGEPDYDPMRYCYGCPEQSYSHYDKDEPERYWYAEHGPGFFQQENLREVEKLRAYNADLTRVVCGVAAWDQIYPANAGGGVKRSGEESILEALFGSVPLAREYNALLPDYWGGWRFFRLVWVLEEDYVKPALDLFRASRRGVPIPF